MDAAFDGGEPSVTGFDGKSEHGLQVPTMPLLVPPLLVKPPPFDEVSSPLLVPDPPVPLLESPPFWPWLPDAQLARAVAPTSARINPPCSNKEPEARTFMTYLVRLEETLRRYSQ
jgi:hypothetical protein